jgi:hypothetical protein
MIMQCRFTFVYLYCFLVWYLRLSTRSAASSGCGKESLSGIEKGSTRPLECTAASKHCLPQTSSRSAGIALKSSFDDRLLGLRMGGNLLGRDERTGITDLRVSHVQLCVFVTEARTVVVISFGRNPISVKRSADADSELLQVRAACHLDVVVGGGGGAAAAPIQLRAWL